jgi:hypothetical protein
MDDTVLEKGVLSVLDCIELRGFIKNMKLVRNITPSILCFEENKQNIPPRMENDFTFLILEEKLFVG